MALNGEAQARRHIDGKLRNLLRLQTKWDELCQDGLTLATGAVNERLEATYADDPVKWPPVLLAFPNLQARYWQRHRQRAQRHLESLGHLVKRLEGVQADIDACVQALEATVARWRAKYGNDAVNHTPVFQLTTLPEWVAKARAVRDMYQQDLAARHQTIALITAVETRAMSVTLLSAWLNSVALDPEHLKQFKATVELELP
ncbi:hypothetical protein H4R34_001008 [Dimargaris verticillata]|uniref:Uncharacterized protein n=1 Tax=Dimargaris verticillata TaxID=2761393 RepID=A0A9W8EFD6_9FUNG|nr:hypothetical protein H4R34_001008 [Dimargaris verticillata]